MSNGLSLNKGKWIFCAEKWTSIFYCTNNERKSCKAGWKMWFITDLSRT
jgi:hypothetical protein